MANVPASEFEIALVDPQSFGGIDEIPFVVAIACSQFCRTEIGLKVDNR